MNEKQAETTPKDQRRHSTTRYLKLNRLPTLQEVLDRRTRPPLDLFCFYIFLQRESAEDALDFWLDVQQHENMCKAYFKDLKRSGRTIQEDWPEYAAYARTNGSHYAPLLDLSDMTTPASPREQEPTSPNPNVDLDQGTMSSPIMRERRDTESHGPRTAFSPEGGRPPRDRPSTGLGTITGRGRRSMAPTVIARDRAIEKAALVEGAERIFLRYLLPGAEREIYLPPSLRVTNFPISSPNDASPLIPDLFHPQKVYIFKALEQDAFPRFLRAKAFGNLTPLGSFARLIAGLLCLWGGFVLAFSLIFLDWKPKRTRLWVILPFIFGTNLLLSAYYSLSPFLAVLQQSETTPFRLIRVREGYVRRLLLMRALWIEALCIGITAVLTVIFALVPGHRL
ncbi:putative Bud site selection-related protein [Naematelia encephala]|uniref:Putative Bud site selection-related protein n=1 Tax=Naematelia encephala TaxID=71784 RepID=A0A1Y2AQQ3_9TREE|nr:putative Bud site selection-related protein [Naematelia encephala]